MFIAPRCGRTINNTLGGTLSFLGPRITSGTTKFIKCKDLNKTHTRRGVHIVLNRLDMTAIRAAIGFSLVASFRGVDGFIPGSCRTDGTATVFSRLVG